MILSDVFLSIVSLSVCRVHRA